MSEHNAGTERQMRVISRQLVAYEAAVDRNSETALPICRVFDALRSPLCRLIGVQGFRVLAARAVTLTKPKVPSLIAVTVKPDGSLAGLSDLNADELSGGVELIAQLLELLATFVGEKMMFRILLGVWPELILGTPEALEKVKNHDSTR